MENKTLSPQGVSGTSAALAGTKIALSASQREVWLDQMAWPHSIHLNIGGAVFLHGPLNLDLMHSALKELVRQNQALRLVPNLDGQQVLLDHFDPPLPVENLADAPDIHRVMRERWQKTIQQPFELGTSPPWRFALFRVHDRLHGLSLQFHHCIVDGWTTSLVLQRWTAIYNAMLAGQPPLPPQQPDYLQFVEETERYRGSDAMERDREFWLAQIGELPPPLLERRRSDADRMALPTSHLLTQRIERSQYNQVARFAADQNLTVFNLFFAALAIYFGRCNQQARLLVGVPTLNRSGRRFRETMGMFVGALAVSVDLKPQGTVGDLLAAIALNMRGALRHPRLPLSEVARSLQLIRSGRDSVFDLLLSFERQDYKLAFGEASLVESHQTFAGFSRYPCSVTVCEFHDEEDVEIHIEASSAYFAEAEARLLGGRLWHLVQQMVAAPHALVDSLPLLPPAEKALLLDTLQPGFDADADPEPFIYQFERQAASHPDATAVSWNQGRMSYRNLNDRAERLADRLAAQGVKAGEIVAFAIERSAEMLIAILGIVKMGAAYLPLDPDAPVARMSEILAEAKASAFLFKSADAQRLNGVHTRSIQVDKIYAGAAMALPVDLTATLPARAALGAYLPRARVTARDMAYVLFTSGSTGKPKGVVIEHGALSARLRWLTKAYQVTRADCAAQATQATFDPSLIELCLPLVHGGRIALPPPGRILPESLAEFAVQHGVTIMAFVPSTLARFLDAAAGLPNLPLRVACCGGEVLQPELVNRYLSGTRARLFNVYGPTEATIFATAWEAQRSPPGSVLPIGKAIDDTRIYVLDKQLGLLPVGVTGEVFIGGRGLARGYLNRPDLTAAAFLDNPFQPGEKMYRTGDRGWLDAQGTLNFVGRNDRQIKLRGYRIELGEIEAALMAAPGVTQAAAKLLDHDGKPRICAWVAPHAAQTVAALQQSLRMRLPSYMVPSVISLLDKLPESSVGKIDYAALPAPQADAIAAAGRQPENAMERNLLALWQQVLKQPVLTVEDNFFDVGGDSLAAVSILAGIEKLIGRRVPMYLLTERPTVEGLAAALGEGTASTGLMLNLQHDGDVPLPGQGVAPVYLCASGHGDLMRFQNLARTLHGQPEVRMLQPPSASTVVSTKDLAALYAGAVAEQGEPACYLAGFSVGGLAALETAMLLQAKGMQVKGLFLIDTIYPSRLWGGTILWRLMGWLVKHLHIQDLSMNGRRLGAMLNDPGLVGQVMAVSGYRVSIFDGPTHLVKSAGLASTWDRLLFLGWRQLLGRRLLEYKVKGLHGSMFDNNNVEELAKVIRVAASAQRASPGA